MMPAGSARQADIHYREGLRWLEAGDRDGAYRAFLQAVRLDDALAAAHYRIGNHFRMTGRPREAERALRAAIARDAGLFDAYVSLAFLYRELGRVRLVEPLFDHWLRHNGADAAGLRKAAALLADFRRFGAAARAYEALTKLAPADAPAYQRLGECLQKTGDYAGAESALLKAVELDPDAGPAYLRLAHNRRWSADAGALTERLGQALTREDISTETTMCLRFALGKIHDDLAHYDTAFDHFESGNRLRRVDQSFDREQFRATLARQREQTGGHLLDRRAPEPALARPGFIIGMLRSGTTLTERILGRHGEVCALGELDLMDRLATRTSQVTGLDYPASLRALSDEHVAALRGEYFAQWPEEAHRARLAVDKNPLNFVHIALIKTVFPEALIVHCVRDPRDICLSIYFQNFAHERNAYAYSLDDIAFFYREYRRFMDHVENALPETIYRFEYERLVNEPEAGSRRLVAAAGLEWDARCLEHQLSDDAIATASLWQARQPIYRRSIGRWRHYRRHIAPLLAALDEFVDDKE